MTELNGEVKQQVFRSVRIRAVAWIMVIVSLALSIALFSVDSLSSSAFQQLREATDEFILCERSIRDMADGSNYLTAQVRSFAVTGKKEYMQNYFLEATVTQRRDKALFTLNEHVTDPFLKQLMNDAMNTSLALMEREYYIMVLTVESMGEDLADYPVELQNVVLTLADQDLSPEEKRDLAMDQAFGHTYSFYRSEIDTKIASFESGLVETLGQQQAACSRRLAGTQFASHILVGLFFAAVAATFVVLARLVILPLLKSTEFIESQKFLPIRGAREMRLLAANYNRILEKILAKQEHLNYAVEHDSLTGAYSRAIFDKFCNDPGSDDPIALMLVDLDHFKTVNDTFGHKVGDKVLKRAAELLLGAFRSDDLICRIGGDEFAGILFGMTPESKELLREKIMGVEEALKHPEDPDLPPCSLSLGVAFGPSSAAKELHVNADTAMYQAKKAGRGTVVFFEK